MASARGLEVSGSLLSSGLSGSALSSGFSGSALSSGASEGCSLVMGSVLSSGLSAAGAHQRQAHGYAEKCRNVLFHFVLLLDLL